MDNIIQNLSDNPALVVAIIVAGLLVVFFLFKQLLKLALLCFLIILAVGGYFYFKDPGKMPQNMLETYEKAKTQTGKAVEMGKEAYSKSSDMVEKGKKILEGMDNLLVGKDKKPQQKETPETVNRK